MESTVAVRAPRSSDEPTWRRLWAGYLEFYEVTVAADATNHTWKRILDAAGSMFGRIATRDGDVVGFAICVIHEGSWSVRSTCYLEDFFVDAGARGAGVGRALLRNLVELAAERDWDSVYWHTRADNTRARALYDSFVGADDFVRYRLAIRPSQHAR